MLGNCIFTRASRVEPELVALHASRGHESLSGKLFMRYTVLVADLLVFFTAVLALLPALHRNAARFLRPIEAAIGGPSTATDIRTSGDVGDGGDESLFDESHADGGSGTDAARGLLAIALALAHPAYILIDHGHFQYNCVCLGLVLWAVHHLVHGRELVGSVCFVAALGYKQMALYFAPSFFCYLAGRAWQRSGGSLNRCAILFFQGCVYLFFVRRLYFCIQRV